MSNFGDVSSAAHARDREALRLALANYDDRVPPLEVVAYVKRLDATLWPVTWRGGDGASDDVLYAHKHEPHVERLHHGRLARDRGARAR
jgi:hypothetical protein